jgi:YVTN family beta-propeller protein
MGARVPRHDVTSQRQPLRSALVTRRYWTPLVPLVLLPVMLSACSTSSKPDAKEQPTASRGPANLAGTANPGTAGPSASSGVPAAAPEVAGPSARRRLKLAGVVSGHITPKSVVASGRGLILAQNMMYTHTVTAYNRAGVLVKTIPDTVRLSDFGFGKYPGTDQGAPVEAAFAPDGRHAYISNYSMYGPRFGREGTDSCTPSSGYNSSFLYRLDTASLRIDQVLQVGAVPKYVAVSPDGRLVLASNWCSYSLSVLDAANGRQLRQVALGPYPRGIVVQPDSRTAYVAVMGSTRLARVDLRTYTVHYLPVGAGPRHLVRDRSGRWLYVTLNSEGRIAKVDLRSGRVVRKVATGQAPRSMAISADGQSLYVVNYESDTVSKVRTADMHVLQTVSTRHHPIGITYDSGTGDVWVACYSGSLMRFRDI